MKFDGRIVDPPNGTVRLKKRFAFLPTRAGDQYVWFQSFQIMEAFVVSTYAIIVAGEKDDKGKAKEKLAGITFGRWVQVGSSLISK